MGSTTNSLTVLRRGSRTADRFEAELCIVGAGISGVACAITAARLGRRVFVTDSAPWVGGQAVGVPIGTIAGLFSTGPVESLTFLSPLLASEILAQLRERQAAWPMYSRRARTLIIVYDEAELERIIETMLLEAGAAVVLGATACAVERDGNRVTSVSFATRFGFVSVQAPIYIDASGDASLTWLAGTACRVSTTHVYGTQIVVLENVNLAAVDDVVAIVQRAEALLRTHAETYGLSRLESRVFLLPQRRPAILNATHLPTPLHPVKFGQAAWPARREAERAAQLLREQYPEVFAQARLRRFGSPGIRQTRTIVGKYSLTAEEVHHGTIFPDAIARVAWPVELHNSAATYRWEPLPDGHFYTIPYRALLPGELANVLAIGRCIDADPVALSSARVMGPCMAMGVAAAHAADLALAADTTLAEIDVSYLQARLKPNLSDFTPSPWPAT
ncbi:MAG: FAD-dependent oxidoreductase [Thermomicrobium sp.]